MSAVMDYFDIPEINRHMTNCLMEDGDIEMDSYLMAYKELEKFCTLAGSIFSFVKDELNSKAEILRGLKEKDPTKFQTFKSMVKYEKEAGLLEKRDYVSGCRTLLRLHWGLDFIRMFLKRVHEMESHEGTSSVGREVYAETLGTHHPWYLRMATSLAMISLPVKSQLQAMMFGEHHDGSCDVHIPEMLLTVGEVFDRTESLYRNNNLLNLD